MTLSYCITFIRQKVSDQHSEQPVLLLQQMAPGLSNDEESTSKRVGDHSNKSRRSLANDTVIAELGGAAGIMKLAVAMLGR